MALTLKQMRADRGLTLRQVQAETGIFAGRLSQLERGLFPARFDEIETLSKFYGVDVNGWHFVPEWNEPRA